jgi:ribosome biogenesis GTPase A
MNPVIGKLKRSKPCLQVLSKKDLADPDVTEKWIHHLNQKKNNRAIAVNSGNRKNVNLIARLCREITAGEIKRSTKAMIVGIPNVGKSTFLNTMAGRKVAKTGDEPAVTRHQQRVQIVGGKNGLDIFDTPGVLWPNLEDRDGAYRLAASGAVKSTAMDFLEVAFFAAGFLASDYPDLLARRYRLDTIPVEPLPLLEAIGKNRGCLKAGGVLDLHKVSEIMLNELKSGKIGLISFEKPSSE